ncbi:MAG TPA: ABC transporter permease, partial [Candidatus Saccharimonadia bacterium]|nr:ABC transporter permease [Candidatus Saccharimonadia bacterium]
MQELNAILTIAYRDILGFFRDRSRMFFSLIFSVIFVGIIGGMLGQNLGRGLPFNYTQFVFFGVLTMTLFQGALGGIISLVRDRENNFSQEIMIAPISRYSIILGKVIGSSTVSVISTLGIIVYGLVTNVGLTFTDILTFIPVAIVATAVGSSMGLLLIGVVKNQQTFQMLFPLVIFPQTFVAGILTPVNKSSWWLSVISHIAPLTYVVDFMRN